VTAGHTGPRAQATARPVAARSARWLARLAVLAAAAAVVVPLLLADVWAGIGLLLLGVAGVAVALAAAWWFLTHRGVVRWISAVVAVAVPLAVAVVAAQSQLLRVVLVGVVLWAAAGAAGAAALARVDETTGPELHETPPPRSPFLIMNPRSGGGKVARFGLVEKARAAGAEVVVLGEGPEGGHTDVADLAHKAVAEGADLLGVAGGDGTQALVAGIAAEHDLPFMVISAGTRNHFALDLGLDREDPSRCLDALTDGVEIRVDLGVIAGRTFVNNASFGAYAAIVQSPAYRDDKARTTLDMLPDLLTRHQGPRLEVQVDDRRIAGPQAVLVSNNPYGSSDLAGLSRRARLDTGVLGVLAVTVDSAADAADLVRGSRTRALWRTACAEVVVDADAPFLPVGVDGEALSLPTPVRCTTRPGALRVRVPRNRPGVRRERPEMDWGRLGTLALPAGRAASR
jgi:diacylglycerol kinase family enzyme